MIIADACCNHLGDDRIIDQMIDLCPADIIKFQLFDVNELGDEWQSDYSYYKSCQLSDEQVKRIIEKCKKKGIVALFTVFTVKQAMLASKLGVTYFKIASPSAGTNPFCDLIYGEKKPPVISTGMNTPAEIAHMMRRYPKATFLKCISRYPAVWTEKDKEDALSFDGISDHSQDIDTALWAVRNNLWVERHYTLGKSLPGKDHRISSTPDEFANIVSERNYINKIDKYKRRWIDG